MHPLHHNVMDKEDNSKGVSNWETLHRDNLTIIFDKLDVMDITMGASRVCISWFLASHNKTLWNTVDLTKLQQVDFPIIWMKDVVRPIVLYKHRVDEEVEEGLSLTSCLIKIIKVFFDLSVLRLSLMDLLIDITKLSRMAPKNLLFNFSSYILKEDLMFAANRMPNIEKLVLPVWCNKTKNSFRFAFSQWKNLKTLIIAHDEIYTGEFEFQTVGENCSNLINFKYLGYLQEDNAEEIVRYLQSLKRLSLRCSSIKTRGVLSLITGLKNLMILNLSHCIYSDLYLDMGLHDYFVKVSTQKLEKKVIKCTQDCRICKDQCGFSWSHLSEDWCNDEIQELEF